MPSDEVAQIGVGIEAHDKTGPGAKSAEKRLSQVGENAKKTARKSFSEARKLNDQAANDDARETQRRRRSLFSYARTARETFSTVEKAAARTFGTRSITSGLEGATSKVGNTLTLFSKAMGEAGEGAAALEVSAGVAATGIGALIAVVGAGAIAAQKFGDAWAKSANQVARTAQIFGVNSQTMQAFDAVAQRFGAAKGVGAQAVTGISQGLNDAIYGDAQKRFIFSQAGIALRRNKDGSAIVDDKTLINIADSLSKRNNVGQRQIAGALNIPLDAAAALIQGAKKLRSDLADTKQSANVQSDASLAHAEDRTRNSTRLSQIKDREVAKAGEGAASLTDGLLSTELKAAQAFSQAVDGNFKGSIGTLKTAVDSFSDAVDQFASPWSHAISKGGGAVANEAKSIFHGIVGNFEKFPGAVGSLFSSIVNNGERSAQSQVSPKGAVGVSQLLPSTAREVARNNGIPWDEHRFRTDEGYNATLGAKYTEFLLKRYSGDRTLAAAAYNAGIGRVDDWVGRMGDPRKGDISDQDFAHRIPIKETRDYVGRVVPSEPTKVHVTVEVPNAPTGTRATARTPGGAVSHAMAN